MKTIIIAGLGNPGKKYEKTRHNAGFLFVDYFFEKFHAEFSFSDWEFKKNLNAKISAGKMKKNTKSNFVAITGKVNFSKKISEDIKIILLKPRSFMNLSGETVQKALNFYKLKSENLIVAHDDIDLLLGKYKISQNSSSAGHNGAQNIIDLLGTKNFARLRIGVENREDKNKIPTEKYVLGKFTIKEEKIIKKTYFDLLWA